MDPRVHVIVLNWNNWRDTLECLESLYRLDYPVFDLIVCDNASTDGSVSNIVRWCEGKLEAGCASNDERIRALVLPPVRKPVPVSVIDRPDEFVGQPPVPRSLTILRLAENRGYAAGNNAGLEAARTDADSELFWILNNDTVVHPGALRALVQRIAAAQNIGLCGSLLVEYSDPDRLQAAGGAAFNRGLALARHIGEGLPADHAPPTSDVERAMRFVVGASVLVTGRFLRTVGPMSEEYFLYFEELDWAMRGAQFGLGFARDSVVYHKVGASAGSSTDWRTRSAMSDICDIRNRLVITSRYFPAFYPLVFLSTIVVILRRIWRRQFGRAAILSRILMSPKSFHLPPNP